MKAPSPAAGITRIASLDGVRALAILLVIALHFAQRSKIHLAGILFFGQDGVGLFFILSGFLVTSLLLRERERTGKINISYFYFRRAMRILPPLLAYLAIVEAALLLSGHSLGQKTILSVVFFFHNMIRDPSWQVEHTWSLAVEEQFYVLWPLLLTLAIRRGRKFVGAILTLILLLTPILRIGGHLLKIEFMHHRQGELLFTRMDALAAGCLMACLIGSSRFESLYSRTRRFHWSAAVLYFGVFPLLVYRYNVAFQETAGYTLEAITGAVFILWLSRNKGVCGRIANHPTVALIGVMSYSTYLWQTLATHYADTFLHLGYALLFIGVATWMSFHFVEKPSLALRKRVERHFADVPPPQADIASTSLPRPIPGSSISES